MIAPRTSIRRKLTFAIVLTSLVVLALTTIGFVTYEVVALRNQLQRNMLTLARVISANSSGALAFQDETDAAQVLSALQAEPDVVAAALYTSDGKIFARYPHDVSPGKLPRAPQKAAIRFQGSSIVVFEPVVQAGRPVGTLYLQSSLAAVTERLRLYGFLIIGVFLASLLISWLLAHQLQKSISQPILALTGAAEAVTEKQDYSVRAPKLSEDEIGLLTDAFNEMLSKNYEVNRALSESGARLRLALEASRTGTWDVDLETRKATLDDFSQALFGLQSGEFKGTLDDALKHVVMEDRQLVRRGIEEAALGRKDLTLEFRLMRPDGSFRRLISRGRASYGPDGKPQRMSGVVADVTESREAEEAQRFLAAIVESSDDAVVGKDLEGRVISWNSGAEQMFGYKASEMIGQTMERLIPPEHRDDELAILEAIRKGQIFRHDSQRIRKDGVLFYVSVTASPVRDSGGKIIGFSAISRDITQRKVAEAENQRLKAELEQRVRDRTAELEIANKELEAFTYSVAHDLRAPLRHMDAYAQVLKSEFQLAPDMLKYVERISLGSQNMGRLVDDLLNLARIGRQELKREPTSLDALVGEIVAELNAETEGRAIEWRIAPLPSIECDPGLMKQVLTNLLSNAVKYSRPRSPAIIEVGSYTKDKQTVFFVRDNGVGFNMKYAHKLFGVFQRLHRIEDFEGTGVGLAIVERIIRKHGGEIWAEAELDKGATFHFTVGR